ncbi:MAG: 50S ribosomal protein L4 [Clostridia bacterium]|jgi:large subunit ribosomal protein L4|nr:50S ribosomal protein L4 [Clostridia bacterium]MDD4275580.1 50S ribosomal protein L4 [Clostridia bacterium]
MAKVKLYDMQANPVGELNLNDEIFGLDYNEPLIHQVIVAMNANARQGTKSTLSQSEVRGGKKKPYAQKHTGQARHANTVAPQFRGGGMAFAIKPRDYSKKVNKVAKDIAFRSALSQKLVDEEIIVIDQFKLIDAKTKEVVAILDAFKANKSVIFVTPINDEILMRAASNLANVKTTTIDLLNVYDIVASQKCIFTKEAIEQLEEAYAE